MSTPSSSLSPTPQAAHPDGEVPLPAIALPPVEPPPRKRNVWAESMDRSFEKSWEKREAQAGVQNPWIQRKLVVGLVLAIVSYTSYAFCRICVGSLNGGRRREGIAFLSVYCILLALFLWSYAKICCTGPGFARDHVSPEMPPTLDQSIPYVPPPLPPVPGSAVVAGPAPVIASFQQRPLSTPTSSSAFLGSPSNQEKASAALLERIPPEPEAIGRVCRHCHFARPPRAHHDRVLGTCVLAFDHFCPWVGTTVGWGNHKFFINFLLFSTLYTVFILAISALTLTRSQASPSSSLDGFTLSILVLSSLFTIFTGPMASSHVYLVLNNTTTVESLSQSSFRHSEAIRLQERHGFLALRAKRKQMQAWEKEWGSLAKEGNPWFISRRANWEQVMGPSKLLWFLPLGGPQGDGIEWPRNSRCDEAGRWRRRRDWPTASS